MSIGGLQPSPRSCVLLSPCFHVFCSCHAFHPTLQVLCGYCYGHALHCCYTSTSALPSLAFPRPGCCCSSQHEGLLGSLGLEGAFTFLHSSFSSVARRHRGQVILITDLPLKRRSVSLHWHCTGAMTVQCTDRIVTHDKVQASFDGH